MQRMSLSRWLALGAAVCAVGLITAGTAAASGRDGGSSNAAYSKSDDHGKQQQGGRDDNGSSPVYSQSGSYGNGDQRGDDHGRDHDRRGDHRRNHRRDRDPGFVVKNLVSDQVGVAPTVDTNLVNGWGLVAGPTTPWWVANQGTNTSTLYDGLGARLPAPPNGPLVVNVAGGPTGVVFNGGSDFKTPVGSNTGLASRFIFATLSGKIYGWPTPPPAGTVTNVGVDNSASHAVYTGLAISGDSLYAADFANGRVDVFDGNWAPVVVPGAFTDPSLGGSSFHPFGIQVAAGRVFVTYAKVDPTTHMDEHAPGLGLVDEYSLTGTFMHRVGSFGGLNAPWGIAWAPTAGFGSGSGKLLVGNFGDGRINEFDLTSYGQWLPAGQLKDYAHRPLSVDGLWGIGFGNGTNNTATTTLYFAAGPAGGTHGLYGQITANP
jgi:uncharacterized protein (TIGR03118 family)